MKIFKNKKGSVLDMAEGFIISLFIIAVVAFSAILALTSLGQSSVFPAGSLSYNQSQDVIHNVTTGTSSFFANAGTWFSILSVVIIIGLIALIILYVTRFRGVEQPVGV